ncbi:MAG: hypothetical protein Q7J84_16220 [Sulfuricaulis sp.]|nr:hypothetical protein [Sulfuricaulis sp.]
MSHMRGRNVIVACIVAMAAVGASALAEEEQRDPEIRCCFTQDHLRGELKGVFLIQLLGVVRPIGHLKLITPSGAVLGYDEKTRSFSRPNAEGVYGLGPPSGMSMLELDWNNSTQRTLVLLKRLKGQYRLHVIAERDGRYALSFLVGGARQTGPGAKNSRDNQDIAADIRAGEVHVYTFPSEFDDIYDGSLSPKSPTRFRVERITANR